MQEDNLPLVFDTSPLYHLTKAGGLEVLRTIIGDRQPIISYAVQKELKIEGGGDSRINNLLNARWIGFHEVDSPVEIDAYLRFTKFFMSGNRNKGEATVLALAKTLPGIAVIDDNGGRKAAEKDGILCSHTLKLLCDAIREGHLSLSDASSLVDDLLGINYQIPFAKGEFEQWAKEHALFGIGQD